MAEKLKDPEMPHDGEVVEADAPPPPQVAPVGFLSYRRKKQRSTGPREQDTARQQLLRYLDMDPTDNDDSDGVINPFSFWAKYREELPLITRVAEHVLIVPATSAPVERIFSHGGLIARPHRATISDKNLCSIIFLKCNRL